MAIDFLKLGPADAPATVLLAHGAGAAMDSTSMTALAEAISDVGLEVVRFEFAYMAARREGRRRPPPRADRVVPEFVAAVQALESKKPLIIGGKSMGGRVATMAADTLYQDQKINGVLCFGYPFHPPAKPQILRTAHLENIATPTLIFQGTRDPFGTREEVPDYALSPHVDVHWMEDGDHDLKPRKKVSGLSMQDHLNTLADRSQQWIKTLL